MFFVIKPRRLLVIIAVITTIITLILFGTKAISTEDSFITEDEQISQKQPVPIIMYHNFLKTKSLCGKFTITPEQFEKDIIYLKDRGYSFINCEDIINYVYNNKDLPEKSIMLTIDDGYYNNYVYIFPIIKKYNVKIVISPIGIETDRYTESLDLNPAYANMCWDNLKQMHESGLVEIQNHTYNLHKLTNTTTGCSKLSGESEYEYKNRIINDIKKANDVIYENVGISPVCMVFPFGITNKTVNEAIKYIGFKMSLSCTEGINFIDRNPQSIYMLKRFNRPYNISSENFFKVLN